ncbi:MAG TPA: glycosyltransferase family 2 protein [Acidobacteriota bacterium]|nr:glycosyltransferase family 2 protein [Acidobacteriota bacterium]
MKPLVSIITLNWNRKDDVARTLSLIQEQTYEPKEILMVDNGSTDGSVDLIRSSFPDVKVIALPKNTGVQGYNEGISAASGSIILLIDNDMDLLQKNTLDIIVEAFNQNPKLGAAALQVRELNDNLSPNNPKYWNEKGNDREGYPSSTFDGGGVAFRKDVLAQTGGYLPDFFVYHSEVDLATRIWDAGFEIRHFPGVAVRHRESNVARDLYRQTMYSTRNYFWYVWIYYPGNMILGESLHFLQRNLIQNFRKGRSVSACIHGTFAALAGWPRIKRQRRPAKRETIEWMQLLRKKDTERKKSEKN